MSYKLNLKAYDPEGRRTVQLLLPQFRAHLGRVIDP
jgi:hypothetical protein